MKLKTLILCMTVGLSLVGCGSDDNDKTTNQSPSPVNKPLYLVKSTAWVTDAGVSLHFITNTLDSDTVFDPTKALAIQEYTGIAIPDGANPDSAFYAGMKTSGVLRRYTVSDDGTPTLDKELDFSGVTSNIGRNLLRATKFMSPTKAYALDHIGLQVIAFNPTTMKLIDLDPATTDKLDTISLAHLKEDQEGTQWTVFPTTDGDHFVGTMGFYPKGGADTGLTKLVIVDSNTDQLYTDSVNNCGAVSGAAKDAEGNMYFASYTAAAAAYKLGVPYAYVPCVIRVKKGTTEFDDSYNLNMQNLTNNGRMAMGAVTGKGNIAYNLIMSDAGQPIVQDEESAKQAIGLPVWEYHSFDLTDSSAVATKVPGIESSPKKPSVDGLPDIEGGTIGRITSGSFEHDKLGEIVWISHTDNEKATSVYNATDPEAWSLITNSVPGQLEYVGRLK
ncbi:hypothetical protein A3759_14665 [Thalassolituus sp. HI0120]|nr:hypothetical protein A3759_14665 [Thalassolituus sp. HI0120]